MSLHDLPLLSQLTACDPGIEDPIERFHLNAVGTENAMPWRQSYSLEFYMGLNYKELNLGMSPNIIYVRSSIRRLLEEKKLVLIPDEDVLDKLLDIQKHNCSCQSKLYERIRYTEFLPQQEYDYRLRSISLEEPLSVILPDGTRQTYLPTLEDMPHFRSSASIVLVLANAARALFEKVLSKGLPFQSVAEAKVWYLQRQWRTPPSTFAEKPDWMALTHPFDQTDDLVADILGSKKEEPVPDLIPDTSSSVSESSLDTELALHPEEWIQNPGTTRWARRIKKIIGRNLPFEQEVTNDNQLELYAKEKCRSYEEVMRTSRVSVRFEPYSRRRPERRSRDDISIWFI
ncbi:hypothetical protein VNI00_011263 [Paramarasmius palmivorus]|uniref:Uncharacterized protein n=1 Tax=Paramarasmius palmivorus TaxID=297713 RepID=A0AAW0CEE9_9AGAR